MTVPRARAWALLGRVAFAVVVLLSLVTLFAPGSDVPQSPFGVDKLVHAALFAGLAVTGLWAGLRSRWLGVGLVAYGAGSELIQLLAPLGRDGSFGDFAADIAGAFAGFLVGLAVLRRRRPRR